MLKTTNQARLRLVKSDDLDLCSSYSRTAGEPLGSSVRPCSISLIADGERPTLSPISPNVMPAKARSSEMKVANGYVCMHPSLRPAVDSSQRLTVTDVRNNPDMPRPPEMPKNLDTLGKRVRWWREHRKIARGAMAKKVKYSYSGLADLENDASTASEKLHLIAAALGLNPHYLETGDGEPEASHPQEPPPPPDEWPFPAVPRARLKKMNKIERSYLETKLLEAIADIEAERRNRTG